MKRHFIDLVNSSDYEEAAVSAYVLMNPTASRNAKQTAAAVEDYYCMTHIPNNVKSDILSQLMTLNDGMLYQASSALEGAGNGIFCSRDLRAGELVTYYDGLRVTVGAYNSLYAAHNKVASSYAQRLEDSQLILGNVRGDPPLYQNTQVQTETRYKKLRFLEASELGAYFNRKGAGQLLNTTIKAGDPTINTRVLCIRDKRRYTTDELECARDGVVPVPSDALARRHPDAIVNVLYAIRDIPAHTELLHYYGKSYISTNFGCSSCYCPLYVGNATDADGDDACYCDERDKRA